LPARLIVRFRAAGERIALEPGQHRQRLKEVLRAAGVLPWRRDDVPLICSAKSVLAVGDWAIAATLRATASTRRRLRLEWTGAGSIR
jgi:tRNA(Ile)-lysidine synthetase-like protein